MTAAKSKDKAKNPAKQSKTQVPEKRPRGRPSKYTQQIANEICYRLAQGETLRSICRDEHMPDQSTVTAWAREDYNGFFNQYDRARYIGLDAMADETVEISDYGSNDYMERHDPDNPGYALNGEHIQRSRLRVDTRKWYLSKMAPKRFGDRIAVEGGDRPIQIAAVDATRFSERALTEFLEAQDGSDGDDDRG